MDPPVLLSARTDRTASRAIRKFRPDIEGLRAVAVTLVVLSHLGLGCPGGYVGVDVFFVISGFIITRQLGAELNRTARISFREFYARRARRILPAATVVIVGTVLACWKWESPLLVRPDASDGLFSALSAINWRLAVNGTNYFQAGSPPSPFQHFWSLSVEEQFYAVWPVLILVIGVAAGSRYGRRKSLVWALVMVLAVSLTLTIRTTASSPSWAYFGTQTRAWELALGALLAVTVDCWTRMPPALASQMSWLGLGLIALAACTDSSSTEYPGSAVVLPVVGAAFVIAGGSPGWSRSAELVLGTRPAQFLGRTSYSLYLVHWPVLVIAPLAIGGPFLTIRKFAKDPFTVEDLINFGSFSRTVAQFLDACVKARRNLVVSGGTGSGKTTLLNVLSGYIPSGERIVTIEDAAELQLCQEHWVQLESRPPNIEGKGAVTIRDLVRNSLRMRPDRIVVGECRGGEALDMLQAMNTGHDGSLTTLHANSPRDALARLETMVLMSGMELPVRAIREQVASAVNLIVQQQRYADGTRRVSAISEVRGLDGEAIEVQDVFQFRQEGFDAEGRVVGRFLATGLVPAFYEELQERGVAVNMDVFQPA